MRTAAGTRNPPWIRDELILALDLYLRYSGDVPGKSSDEIAQLSDDLNAYARLRGVEMADRFRNTNGVYMKLMNFRRLDPKFIDSGRVGLSRGSKLEEVVWTEFSNNADQCR